MAIIGVAVRLPGGICSLDELWLTLDERRDLVTEVPADRFSAARFHDPTRNRAGKAYTVAGGFAVPRFRGDAKPPRRAQMPAVPL